MSATRRKIPLDGAIGFALQWNHLSHGHRNSRHRRHEARRAGLRAPTRRQVRLFQYCISIVILTFRRPSDIYFLRQGENATVKGLPFTLLSLVAGWWGIPWGPIYTIQSVYNNSRGGKDVTQAVVNSLRAQAAPAQTVSPVSPKG
jgi:hypothetical protein